MRLERNDLPIPVHDGTVSIDGSFDDLIVVLKVNDDDLGLVVFIDFLPNADIVI